jgi:uncharacterized protein (TIGR02452 family)
MSLTDLAKHTLDVIAQGSYQSPSGATVVLRERIDAAVRGSVLYRPADLDALWARLPAGSGAPPRVEVTAETTTAAARRLTQDERLFGVCALNFASAKNPGGGFLGGAKAQEEDLARCSALYPCLLAQREYYDANRAHDSMLYTDHLIYSPDVPFFRDDRLELLESPYLLSILTAPAPNAGEALRRDSSAGPAIRAVLSARAGKVLAVAAARGHRCLVLGAWGCGVFRNDPEQVAEIFATWLADPRFSGAFDRVIFAIYDRRPDQPALRPFASRFGS